MVQSEDGDVVYLTIEDFHQAAAEALEADLHTVRAITNETLAGSALAAPSAGFGGYEQYPDFATKAAVLLQAIASNHPLPDGNKRTSLLCAILFAALNGFSWVPPLTDDPDGSETAEVVEGAATRSVPLGALSAWVEDRLVPVPPAIQEDLSYRAAMVIYPAEYVGALTYADNAIEIGDLTVHDVHGYNPAGVYVRRISGKAEGSPWQRSSFPWSVMGTPKKSSTPRTLKRSGTQRREGVLAESPRWQGTYGRDGHPLTDDEFEADWAEAEES